MQQLDKWNKELERLSNKKYKNMDSELFRYYKQALREMKIEIKAYIENYEVLSFSKKLEVEQQLKFAKRIDEILWDLNDEINPRINEHVTEEAKQGYYGTWYALEGNENIQLDFPVLNESYIERLLEKKVAGKTLSKRLYDNRDQLAERVTTALFNGAVKGKGYAKVAKEIGELTEANYKQSLRIARTEGGRVQSSSKQKAYEEAKNKGISLQKRWLATLDKKTRHQHQQLDGHTVDVEEQFNFNGNLADGPRLFGIPGLDINCRCTTISVVNGMAPDLRRNEEAKENIDYKNYKEWYNDKYNQGIDEKNKMAASRFDESNMKEMVGDENYNNFINHLKTIKDNSVNSLYEKFGDKLMYVKLKNGRAYASRNVVQLSQENFDGNKHNKPFEIIHHENGHAMDHLGIKSITGSDRFKIGTKSGKVGRKKVEFDVYTFHASGLPQYELDKNIKKDLWKYVNKDLPMYEDLGRKPRNKEKREAYDEQRSKIYTESKNNFLLFKDKMLKLKEEKPYAVGTISDIIESTGYMGEYPLGYGHGKRYWKDPGKAETEFFAHVTESLSTNPEALEMLEQIFPNSLKIWEDIVKDILKGGE